MTPPRTTLWTKLFGTREERVIHYCRREVRKAFERMIRDRVEGGGLPNVRLHEWESRKKDLAYALEHYLDHTVEAGDAVKRTETHL